MPKFWNFSDRVFIELHAEDAQSLPKDWQNSTSPAERERAASMQSAWRATTFLKARSLLRIKLGELLGMNPSDLPILLTPEGKPFLAITNAPAFSLSHAHGSILIGLAPKEKSLGIDLEYIDLTREIEKLATRFMTAVECATLAAIPSQKTRCETAYKFWCLHEARFKCGPAIEQEAHEESGFLDQDFAYAVCYRS